jgi:hypothetical protein
LGGWFDFCLPGRAWLISPFFSEVRNIVRATLSCVRVCVA